MNEFRITYKDTQRASGDENNQIKGISIFDNPPLITSIVGSIVVISGTSLIIAPPPIVPTASLGDRTIFWQTYVDFFTVGKTINISGTPSSDGDYPIISITSTTAPAGLADDPGSLSIVIGGSAPGGLGLNDITFTDVSPVTVIPLQGSGSPDRLQIIDNNEDKFTTIRAKQLTIEFIATSSVDINTFAPGEDNRWYVTSWTNTTDNIDFKGYLITDDLQQPFLPVEGNIVVTLLATDRLGTLKDVPLTDDDKKTPQGKWRIAQFLNWMLKKTGMSLNLFVVNNIRHGSKTLTTNAIFQTDGGGNFQILTSATNFFYTGMQVAVTGTAGNNITFTVKGSGLNVVQITLVNESVSTETVVATFTDLSDGHFYDKIFLDAKTFEGESVGICTNCYDALDIILKDSCFIEQSKGNWWIHRVAEMEGTSVSVAHFDVDGAFVDIQTKTYSKSIGRNETIKWADASSLLRLRRAMGNIVETYKYTYPLETVCNFDFSRGDFISTLSDVVIGADTYNASSYAIECWTNTHSPFTPGQITPPPTFAAYVKRLFQNGYEKQRFIVLPTTSAGTDFLESQPIIITQGDKFSVSVDFAWNENAASGSVNLASIMYVTLKGDDDTNWFLDVNDPAVTENKWLSAGSGATWSPLNGIGMSWDAGDVDETAFRTLSAAAAAAPVSGQLRFALISIGSVSGSLDDKDMYYNNFQFNYIPFINGSYQKYTGQTHTVSQTGDYIAKRENEVKISDSPRNIFKGSMFFNNGTSYLLTQHFYDALKFPAPVDANLKPYGEIQSQDVWTQVNREMRIFSGTLRGIDSDVQDSDDLPDMFDLIHQYLLTDSNQSTDNKVFLMISYEQDRKSQLSQSTLIEVFDSVAGKTPGDHVFKYLTE